MLHVDAPGRKDRAEQVEAAEMEAPRAVLLAARQPYPKSRGAEGGVDGDINGTL